MEEQYANLIFGKDYKDLSPHEQAQIDLLANSQTLDGKPITKFIMDIGGNIYVDPR